MGIQHEEFGIITGTTTQLDTTWAHIARASLVTPALRLTGNVILLPSSGSKFGWPLYRQHEANVQQLLELARTLGTDTRIITVLSELTFVTRDAPHSEPATYLTITPHATAPATSNAITLHSYLAHSELALHTPYPEAAQCIVRLPPGLTWTDMQHLAPSYATA